MDNCIIVNIDNINNNEIRVKKKGNENTLIKIQPLDFEKESHFDFDDCYTDIFQNIERIQINDSNISFQEKFYLFENLIELYIKNSNLNNIPIKFVEKIKIKGNMNNIENNLNSLEQFIGEGKIEKLNEIYLYFILNNNKNFDIFSYFQKFQKCFEKVSSIKLSIKGNFTLKETEEKVDEIIQSKIKSLIIKSFNELEIPNSFINLIEGLPKIEILFLNNNNINNNNLLKLSPYLENTEDIEINFDCFSVEKLKKIDLPLFQYNLKKKKIVLYGEANIEFYNENNFNFITKIIKLNKGEFKSVSLCNFDIENINYLSKIIEEFTSIKKLVLENLNLNDIFVNTLRTKKLFNCSHLELNNIIYLTNRTKSDFLYYINRYKGIEKASLKSIDYISEFSNFLQNSNKIYLEEIYSINYYDLKRITDRCEYLTGLNFSQLEIDNDNLCEKVKNILFRNRKSLKILKINSDDTFFFIYNYLNNLSDNDVFHCLETLDLNFDTSEFTEELKSKFLKEKYFLFPNLTKINLRTYNLETSDKKEIYLKYPKLLELN